MGIGADLGFPEADLGDFLDMSWLRKWVKIVGVGISSADRKAVKQFVDFGFFVTDEFDKEILKQARDVIFTQAGKIPGREVAKQVKERVVNWGHGRIGTIVRTNSSRAFNDGRMAQFEEAGDLIQAFQLSAILDDRTTPFCNAHHGQIITTNHPLWGAVQMPNHFNERSVWVPIFAGEDFTVTWTDTPLPMKGFGV